MKNPIKQLTLFLYELSSMRFLPRMHRQTLMVADDTDNIASHSYMVTMIAWTIALREGLDTGKTIKMALLHDTPETRSGDHNWVHKRYVTIDEEKIIDEQISTQPFAEFSTIMDEYQARKTPEAIAAKDADLVHQILLLREYQTQGNQEAARWLEGDDKDEAISRKLNRLQTTTAKELVQELYEQRPSAWWDGDHSIWTNVNR